MLKKRGIHRPPPATYAVDLARATMRGHAPHPADTPREEARRERKQLARRGDEGIRFRTFGRMYQAAFGHAPPQCPEDWFVTSLLSCVRRADEVHEPGRRH